MDELTPRQRRELRARAHHLHPVVSIGQHGLTPRVLNEIDVALTAHALVKIRVHSDDRDAREAMLAGIAAQLHAAAVQHLGKLLIVWRERDEEDAKAPQAAREPRARVKKSGTDRKTGPKAEKAAAARKPKVEPTRPGNWRKRETTPKRPPAVEDEARGAPAPSRRRRAGPGTETVAYATGPRTRGPRSSVKTAPKGTFTASGAEERPRARGGGHPGKTASKGTFSVSGAGHRPRTRVGESVVKTASKGAHAARAPRGTASTSPRSGKPAAPRRRRAS